MGIVSFWFIVLTAVTVILYDLPYFRRYGRYILLAASLIFYISFSPAGLLVLIPDALAAWAVGIRVQKLKDSQNADNYEAVQKVKLRYTLGNAALNILLLFLFNYCGGMAAFVNEKLGTGLWTAVGLFVTVGISYFSLKLVSYTADVYGGVIEAEKDPLNVILYAVFFLSIMQGPFDRYGKLMPQITDAKKRKLTYSSVKAAVIRIMYGYIKKMCIADQIGLIATHVFTRYEEYHGLAILTGIAAFAVRLYADFSGYMDIVCGIGQLMGIEIAENFRQPFFSRNMTEFWGRWHITLGAWLKDYVFYPLQRTGLFTKWSKAISRKTKNKLLRKAPAFTAEFIVWLLIGLWHGSGFNYIFGVGILQFIYIFTGTLLKPFSDKLRAFLHIGGKSVFLRIVQGMKCTLLMCFAWVFFNSASFENALAMFCNIFNDAFSAEQFTEIFTNNGYYPFIDVTDPLKVIGNWNVWLMYILVCIFVMFIVDILHERGQSVVEAVMRRPYPIRLAFYMLLIFSLIVFGSYGGTYNASDFIYYRF